MRPGGQAIPSPRLPLERALIRRRARRPALQMGRPLRELCAGFSGGLYDDGAPLVPVLSDRKAGVKIAAPRWCHRRVLEASWGAGEKIYEYPAKSSHQSPKKLSSVLSTAGSELRRPPDYQNKGPIHRFRGAESWRCALAAASDPRVAGAD